MPTGRVAFAREKWSAQAMGIAVNVELSDLSEEGIFEVAKIALQGVDLGENDWNLTGRVVENMRLSLTYREHDQVGKISEPWTAKPERAVLGESATSPHLAVAKAVVMTAMKDEHLTMTVESAIQWVNERCILIDAVEAPSLHHNVIAHGKNRFTVSAKKGGDNLLHFQNIAMLIDALDGEYLKEESRDDASSGISNSITYVLL